ncbi:MAG: ATP-binding cassette domain-containing protein [Clostridiales bacterium]|nr:ATP-binding cassette domain-containing protein [Clostridiales bacterium]
MSVNALRPETGQEPILVTKGLRKVYTRHRQSLVALDSTDLTIYRGEVLGVVGESGCGKTTLGRCVIRAIEPTQGQVHFSPQGVPGVDLLALDKKTLKEYRRHIQMIFQDPYSSLDPRMTVYNIIAEPLIAQYRYTRPQLEEKVAEIIRLTGLNPEFMHRYPHAFSGGQRQRIGIARALVTRPQFVICDEAVSALDVSVQAQIINLLRDLQEQLGLSYMFISHSLSVVEHLSTRVCVMYLGRIVELADTADLFRTPLHPYTEALLSAHPQPDPDYPSRRIILQGEVPNPLNPPGGCPFHPRCRYAVPRCATEVPPLRHITDRHQAACHLAEDLRLEGVRTERTA